MGDGHYDITGLDSGCRQRKPQRIGAAAHRHRLLRAAKLGEGFLKIFDRWTANETGSPERLLEHLG
jgi:hypothetical protein